MTTSLFNDQYYELTSEFVEEYDNARDDLADPFKLPTLYTYTQSTGKYRFYNVGFDGKSLVTEYGQIDGKVVVSRRDVVAKVKRSLCQQAYQECKFRWNKKLKQRYSRNIDQASSLIQRQVMLANKFIPSKVDRYPVYGQIKYDGMRFTATLENDDVTLRSRAGNVFENMSHICDALLPILRQLNVTIDGELIVPGGEFQQTSSRIKGTSDNDTVVAIIFDIITDEPYSTRWDRLSSIDELPLMSEIYGDLLDPTVLNQSSTITDHASTSLGQSSTDPRPSPTSLGQSSTPIDQSSTVPIPSSTSLGQSPTVTDQSLTLLGQSSTIIDGMSTDPRLPSTNIDETLIDIDSAIQSHRVLLIDNYVLGSESEIYELFNDAIKIKQEGVMVRDIDKPYFNGRSNQIMKLKALETDEGEIVNVVDGTGSHRGLAIFVLRDSLNVTTHVVPAATVAERRCWYSDRSSLIGRIYRFAFNERMSDTNAPRNPTGIEFV